MRRQKWVQKQNKQMKKRKPKDTKSNMLRTLAIRKKLANLG